MHSSWTCTSHEDSWKVPDDPEQNLRQGNMVRAFLFETPCLFLFTCFYSTILIVLLFAKKNPTRKAQDNSE